MYGDNGVMVDLGEVGKVVAGSDVLILGFAHFQERLLIDARCNQKEAPLVQVVEAAGSAPERLIWLRRRRPSLGQPQSLTFAVWPHSLKFLAECGVWDRIRERVGADTQAEVHGACELAMRQLQNLHLSAVQALLKGEQCYDLWPRPEVPRTHT